MKALGAMKVNAGSLTGIAADVTQIEDVKKIFSELDKTDQGLCSVIYNAGNNNAKPFLEMDLPFFQDLWEVCAKGAFLISQEAIPRLIDNGGALILLRHCFAQIKAAFYRICGSQKCRAVISSRTC